MNNHFEIVILIAEDDDGHAELIIDGLKETGIKNKIIRFVDGLEIWNYLMESLSEKNQTLSTDFLVLLDINMPRMDGVEVLRKIKQYEKTKNIPVIMLTTTDDPREVEKCYQLGCNVYITKPVEFGRFAETLQKLGYFLQIIKM